MRIGRSSPRIKHRQHCQNREQGDGQTVLDVACHRECHEEGSNQKRDAKVGIEFAANGHPVLPSCRASCVNARDDLSPFVAGDEDTTEGSVGVDDAHHDFCLHG